MITKITIKMQKHRKKRKKKKKILYIKQLHGEG